MTARDKRVLKRSALSEISVVADILRHWDPINVQPGTVGPADEYDSYAPHIVSMVKSGCTIEQLAAHLDHLCVEKMGLGTSSNASWVHNLEFAALIVSKLHGVSAPSSGPLFPPLLSRAERLETLSSQLIADVTLYPSESGGHEIRPGWGCPCVLSMSQPIVGYDGWPLLGDNPMSAGEHRRVGFVFLSGEEAAAVFRKAGRFFLWEGRCIGEAVVVAP